MAKKENSIIKALEIRPTPEPEIINISSKVTTVSDDMTEAEQRFAEDFDFARDTIKDSIKKAKGAFDDLIQFANSAPESRKFEVASAMLNSLVAASEKLVDINKKYQDGVGAKISQTENNITNNNLIVDSSELLNMMRNAQKVAKEEFKQLEQQKVIEHKKDDEDDEI